MLPPLCSVVMIWSSSRMPRSFTLMLRSSSLMPRSSILMPQLFILMPRAFYLCLDPLFLCPNPLWNYPDIYFCQCLLLPRTLILMSRSSIRILRSHIIFSYTTTLNLFPDPLKFIFRWYNLMSWSLYAPVLFIISTSSPWLTSSIHMADSITYAVAPIVHTYYVILYTYALIPFYSLNLFT